MLDGLLAVSPQPGSASRPEEVVPVLERGKRLRPLTGGARSLHRPVLPEDGYDAGVKKPVAVPKKWTVPSGKVWVTSKLQVTRSPCALCLDLAVVSLWVGPPGGLNCCWPESQQAAAFVVAQGLDVHLGPLGQLPGPQSLVAHWQAAVIASPRGAASCARLAMPSTAGAASAGTWRSASSCPSPGVMVKVRNAQHSCSRTSSARTASGSTSPARSSRSRVGSGRSIPRR